MKLHFIVIDDSQLDCFIAEKLILHNYEQAAVTTFTEADLAVEYIRDIKASADTANIILLDILMPVVNGFDFLNEFEKLPADIQTNYYIVAITSSLNRHDISRVCSYKSVKHLTNKPITTESLKIFMENETFYPHNRSGN